MQVNSFSRDSLQSCSVMERQRSEKIYIKAWDWLDPSFDVWRPPRRWWCSSKTWDENWISFTRKWPQRPDTFNREWLRRKFKGNKLWLCYLARSNISKMKVQTISCSEFKTQEPLKSSQFLCFWVLSKIQWRLLFDLEPFSFNFTHCVAQKMSVEQFTTW